MTDIYLVITQDRHADIEVTPFTDQDDAIAFAEEEVQDNARHPDLITAEDRELSDGMVSSGWLYHCRYSCEGDYVLVVRRELREHSDD